MITQDRKARILAQCEAVGLITSEEALALLGENERLEVELKQVVADRNLLEKLLKEAKEYAKRLSNVEETATRHYETTLALKEAQKRIEGLEAENERLRRKLSGKILCNCSKCRIARGEE